MNRYEINLYIYEIYKILITCYYINNYEIILIYINKLDIFIYWNGVKTSSFFFFFTSYAIQNYLLLICLKIENQ